MFFLGGGDSGRVAKLNTHLHLAKGKAVPLHSKQTQSKGRDLSMLDFDAGRGWVVCLTSRQFYPEERKPVHIVQ